MSATNVEYHLEIYLPGSADDVWVSFQALQPFMAFSKGDILNPGLWTGSKAPMRVLRILNVEHIVWEASGHISHKVMLFTEEVEGTRELRLK
jgi:hypothetical protein